MLFSAGSSLYTHRILPLTAGREVLWPAVSLSPSHYKSFPSVNLIIIYRRRIRLLSNQEWQNEREEKHELSTNEISHTVYLYCLRLSVLKTNKKLLCGDVFNYFLAMQ